MLEFKAHYLTQKPFSFFLLCNSNPHEHCYLRIVSPIHGISDRNTKYFVTSNKLSVLFFLGFIWMCACCELKSCISSCRNLTMRTPWIKKQLIFWGTIQNCLVWTWENRSRETYGWEAPISLGAKRVTSTDLVYLGFCFFVVQPWLYEVEGLYVFWVFSAFQVSTWWGIVWWHIFSPYL